MDDSHALLLLVCKDVEDILLGWRLAGPSTSSNIKDRSALAGALLSITHHCPPLPVPPVPVLLPCAACPCPARPCPGRQQPCREQGWGGGSTEEGLRNARGLPGNPPGLPGLKPQGP